MARPGASYLNIPRNCDQHLPSASKGGAATLEFTAFGRSFRLQLSSNERLAQVAAGSSVQLYKGTLEGVPGSWARISVFDGLLRGMIWDGRELFIVDAAADRSIHPCCCSCSHSGQRA